MGYTYTKQMTHDLSETRIYLDVLNFTRQLRTRDNAASLVGASYQSRKGGSLLSSRT